LDGNKRYSKLLKQQLQGGVIKDSLQPPVAKNTTFFQYKRLGINGKL
jgi:hypothetical protein